MSHNLLSEPNLFLLLQQFDEDIASKIQSHGCLLCGGRLDCSNYPRKPRGGPSNLSQQYDIRFSFCCARDGCRKRITPPSVRFLGRRVYLGVVILLVGALRQGPDRWSAQRLHRELGVHHSTLKRWRLWWLEVFPSIPFWQTVGRCRFMPPVVEEKLPFSMLQGFGWKQDPERSLFNALKFLLPITCQFGHVLCEL